MAQEIFIDESGYTGEHQLDPAQPVFVLSSVNLDDATTTELLAKHFGGVQAKELKHSGLSKRPKGQQRVVDFIRTLVSMKTACGHPVATAFPAHKRFQLLTLLVDLWVEPAMRRDGVDMYERGANLGFSNVAFYVLGLVPEFFDELLRHFEVMMRERTLASYDAFWTLVYGAYRNPGEGSPDQRVQKMIREIIVCFMGGQESLGPRHLLTLPDHPLDVAFSTVAATAHYWDERAGQPLLLTLDESKYFAKAKWIWDVLTRPDLPEATFYGSGDARVHFPLNIEATRTADSKQIRLLQFADIVAGAVAEFCASRIESERRSTYTDALGDAGILNLGINAIWPSTDVTPEEMGTLRMSGEQLDYIEAQLKHTRN
jgi:hypothetical protein